MGVGSILGGIGLLGFVLFIAGAALAVVASSQGRPARNGVLLAVAGLVIGILFSIIGQGILIVQPTEVAVVINTLTGQFENPRNAGTSVVIPIVDTYYIYPISQQQYTMSGTPGEGAQEGNDAVAAITVDGQNVSLDITVLYSVNPAKVNELHQRWQTGYQDNFVRPTVRGLVRDIVSGYKAEDIFGAKRTEMQSAMETETAQRFDAEGLTLTSLLVRDIVFSDQFRQAIENKQAADQQAQQAALVVIQRQHEADQARAVAAGQRDAEIAQAQGDAQATILKAQAQAQALELVSQQIAANPSLIQYLYVTNLSSHINLALVPSNSPFLFDFNSLATPNANFTPPQVPESTPYVAPSETATPTPGS